MRTGNVFTDPRTGETWTWPVNHHDESGGGHGLTHNVSYSAPTSLGILLRQQAADSPMVFSWKGTALTRAQHQKFIYWFNKCKKQTIYLTDFSGDKFEVQILAYIPTRKAVAQNHNDPVNANLWLYDFQIDIDVLTAITGDYVGVV